MATLREAVQMASSEEKVILITERSIVHAGFRDNKQLKKFLQYIIDRIVVEDDEDTKKKGGSKKS